MGKNIVHCITSLLFYPFRCMWTIVFLLTRMVYSHGTQRTPSTRISQGRMHVVATLSRELIFTGKCRHRQLWSETNWNQSMCPNQGQTYFTTRHSWNWESWNAVKTSQVMLMMRSVSRRLIFYWKVPRMKLRMCGYLRREVEEKWSASKMDWIKLNIVHSDVSSEDRCGYKDIAALYIALNNEINWDRL